MEEVLNIFLTAALTLIGGIIILLFEKIIEKFYIEPYHKFKSKLVDTKVTLYLYDNIFTNFFELENTGEIFLQKIKESQDLLRKHWSELLVNYNRIINNRLIMSFCKDKVPSEEEMKIIAMALIYVYNSSLVWSKNWKTQIENNSKERAIRLHEAIEILMKY